MTTKKKSKVDLIVPAKPEPIITGLGFAYAVKNAAGEIMAATTVLAQADPKTGGLQVDGNSRRGLAQKMADSIVKFAECTDGEATVVEYMTPDEYAKWCDENEDDTPEADETLFGGEEEE